MQNGQSKLALLFTFIAAVVVNAMVLAYSYGKMEARMQTLEDQRDVQRAEWKEARDRLERMFEKLEAKTKP